MISFEPVSSAYVKLSQRAHADPAWTTFHAALGSQPGTAAIHVAGNSQSSSLLPMQSQHVQSAPDSAYIGTEDITVITLDAIASGRHWPTDEST
ncbi:MAG: hypothetical protein IPN24_13460 [Betaproteobacteria bacterium]|nr:hypothetical protein [Betaproteobacteria bacterium]